MKKTFLYLSLFLVGCTAQQTPSAYYEPCFTPSGDWVADFVSPPDYAKPRVFWWWLEGNVSKEGILSDLLEMKKAGIHGAILFDAACCAGETYGTVTKKTPAGYVFMSPEWREHFVYACHVADSLGMEISMNITSGWNDGGPWVKPEDAAKKIVWSETPVEGPKTVSEQLPLPKGLLKDNRSDKPFYQPLAVLAVKLIAGSDTVKPLENFRLKAVHSIGIPKTKNGLGFDWDLLVKPEQSPAGDCHTRLNDVTDISDRMDAEGNITWDAPAGKYLIMRFGYTGTGVRVSTHSPGGGGLAIDYMSAKATDLQYDHTAAIAIDDVKKANIKSLKFLHDDSWELGAANWTEGFEQKFKAANGYDILPYLPVITGRIVESRDASNRFLYDFRRMIADLIWENHYKRFHDRAHNDGLGVHPESGGPHPAPIDALKNEGLNDIPMGEFWIRAATHRVAPESRFYIKQPASAAHTYGRRFVQAEGPTSIGLHWEEDFAYMKPTLDRAYCEGLNRLVIHTFSHSPKDAGVPGNEYFAGTHCNPNVTWWKQASAFMTWNSRISFMLAQGLFVADIAYYYGDNVPNQVPLKHVVPRLGTGYDYDVVNTEVILNRMTARDGKIYLPDGMSYHALVLPDRNAIQPETLEKIEQLVKNGATVIAPRPEIGVGLRNIKKAEKKINRIANRLWGAIDGVKVVENRCGKGMVVWGKDIRTVLQEKGLTPDFEKMECRSHKVESGSEKSEGNGDDKESADLSVDYIHRCDGDRHIYYVANSDERAGLLNCRFRVEGMQPEIWYPETGEIVPVPVYLCENGQTSLPVFLDPHGSVFVVFRSPAGECPVTSLSKGETSLFPEVTATFDRAPFVFLKNGDISFTRSGIYLTTQNGKVTETSVALPEDRVIEGAWEVSFDTAWRAPANAVFDRLISWTEHPAPGIKYYSGTAVYRCTFSMSDEMLEHYRIYLDLGELHHLAEVRINGQSAGVWWKKPFAGDLSELLNIGENMLEISVVNLWPNRLVGDLFLPENQRLTKTNIVKFTKDSPLLPSGLLGPVKLSFHSKVVHER
jgi:hypothetical protein